MLHKSFSGVCAKFLPICFSSFLHRYIFLELSILKFLDSLNFKFRGARNVANLCAME